MRHATLVLVSVLLSTRPGPAQQAGVARTPPAPGSCGSVIGLPTLSITEDDGLTWATNRRALQLGQATFGLAALDGGVWVAEFGGLLFASRSDGCRWTRFASAPSTPLRLVPGGGNQALAWGFFPGPELWRVRVGVHGGGSVERLPDLPADVLTVAVDPADASRLRAVCRDGFLYEMTDGQRWGAVGSAAPLTALVYFGALDPQDLDHAMIGMGLDGVVVTHDGGASWIRAAGLSPTDGPVNGFNGVFSPADSAVAWVMALDLDEADGGGNGRHVYRSGDGGLSFTRVVDAGPDIVLTNGPVLAPHPVDPGVLYFPFGSRFSGGVWLYRYDHSTGATTWNFSPDFFQIRALVVDPADPHRVLAGFEG